MDINGTYKISIEMTARKMVEGVAATAQRLLGHMGVEMPEPPGMEEQIQSVIGNFRANQEVFDSFEMTIAEESITVRTSEGVLVYDVQSRTDKDENHVVLELQAQEMGELTWDVTFSGKYFLIDSVDGLSEYVFERKG